MFSPLTFEAHGENEARGGRATTSLLQVCCKYQEILFAMYASRDVRRVEILLKSRKKISWKLTTNPNNESASKSTTVKLDTGAPNSTAPELTGG